MLSGSDVEEAGTMLDSTSNAPVVTLKLTDEGTKSLLKQLKTTLIRRFIFTWMMKKFLLQQLIV